MNTTMVKPRFCHTWTMITRGIATVLDPKKADWIPNAPNRAWAGLDSGSNNRSQTIPTTVTPRTIGKNARTRSKVAALPSPCKRWANSIATTFCTTVTPTTKNSVSIMLETKPGPSVVKSAV